MPKWLKSEFEFALISDEFYSSDEYMEKNWEPWLAAIWKEWNLELMVNYILHIWMLPCYSELMQNISSLLFNTDDCNAKYFVNMQWKNI